MSLVEDILDLAKIEAGTFSLNEQPFSVRSLVQDIEYVFAFQCAQKGIYFTVEADRRVLDETFCSDVGRIKQVLNNLISNAFKFTLQGGITLHVSMKQVFDDNLFERVRQLKFEVIDTGIGVDKKEIPKLFTLFGTIKKHHNNLNSKGTGLGLAISKKLVESLEGKISLKSKVNVGTNITFTIKESSQHKNASIEEVKKEIKEEIKNEISEDHYEVFNIELPTPEDENMIVNSVKTPFTPRLF